MGSCFEQILFCLKLSFHRVRDGVSYFNILPSANRRRRSSLDSSTQCIVIFIHALPILCTSYIYIYTYAHIGNEHLGVEKQCTKKPHTHTVTIDCEMSKISPLQHFTLLHECSLSDNFSIITRRSGIFKKFVCVCVGHCLMAGEYYPFVCAALRCINFIQTFIKGWFPLCPLRNSFVMKECISRKKCER